jgi:hypothetical protein
MRTPVAFLALFALAAPASAAEPAPSAPLPLAKAAEKDPLVCRSETPIGSKLPVKTCIRKSERDRQARDSQEALQLIQRRADGPSKERM